MTGVAGGRRRPGRAGGGAGRRARRGARSSCSTRPTSWAGSTGGTCPCDAAGAAERRLHHGWRRSAGCATASRPTRAARSLTGAQVWAIEPAGRRRPCTRCVGPADGAGASGSHLRARTRWCWPPARTTAPCRSPAGTCPACSPRAPRRRSPRASGSPSAGASWSPGAGPFLLPVARRLPRTGARVVGVLRGGRPAALARGWLPGRGSCSRRGKGGELAGYVGDWSAHRIPYRLGTAVVAAHGSEPGRVGHRRPARRRLGADRRAPNAGSRSTRSASATASRRGSNSPIAAGCAIGADGFVAVDDGQRTTRARASTPRARSPASAAPTPRWPRAAVAGHCAAGGDRRRPELPQRGARPRAIPAASPRRIEAAHGIRAGWRAWLDRRHHRLPLRGGHRTGELRDGRRDDTGSRGLRSLKLTTRAGLGICQGRICGRTVERAARPRPGGRRPHRPPPDRRPGPARRTRRQHRSPQAPTDTRPSERTPMIMNEVRPRRRHRRHHAAPSRRMRPRPPAWPSTTTGSPRTATG